VIHILLAEDDKNFGFILKNELADKECAIDLVSDGVEAVMSFLSRSYDFVLLDLRMPRLNGADALRIIKKINPSVPAITMSGKAGIEERAESVECGAIKCLSKPFEVSQLKGDLKSLIQAQSP
jgi:DNA-binding response OmpR family regulator